MEVDAIIPVEDKYSTGRGTGKCETSNRLLRGRVSQQFQHGTHRSQVLGSWRCCTCGETRKCGQTEVGSVLSDGWIFAVTETFSIDHHADAFVASSPLVELFETNCNACGVFEVAMDDTVELLTHERTDS